MDPITHLTAGALLAQSLKRHFTKRYFFFFLVLAAWIPDLDNVVSLGNPELFLIHHRGITHSLAGGLVIAVLLAGIFRLIIKSFPFWWGVVTGYAGILGHIYLDVITTYGTQIFLPFNRNRYFFPGVFIIDPIYTLVMLIILYCSFRRPTQRVRLAVLGLCWILLYPMSNLGIGAILRHQVEDRLTLRQVSYTRVHLVPDLLTPIFWKVIVETPATYHLAGLSLVHLDRDLQFRSFQKADKGWIASFAPRAHIFDTYAWFVLFPVVEREERPDGQTLIFSDLRYFPTLDLASKYYRGKNKPLSLKAFLNPNGGLIGYEYFRPGRAGFTQRLE
ncbi:MAG: metal-dependent hydrolase [Deltaproteobacteria bacterium]|nr:metal-dependent hydrolase [Deltaproteobacteria bacterium]